MALEYVDTIIAFASILLAVSLLITILNQMISAFLGYRGANLRWAVQTLLSTLESGLTDQAKRLASAVLTQPMISDSIFSKFPEETTIGRLTRRWRLASAITPQALAEGLKILSEELREADEKTANLIDKILNQADRESTKKLEMLRDTLSTLVSDQSVDVDKIIHQSKSPLQESIRTVETHFNILMDRASQRFALQMRLWTVGFAILIAFAAHLDSVRILQRLWISPALRTGLVGNTGTLLNEASKVLAEPDGAIQSSTRSIPPPVLSIAMKKLMEIEKAQMAQFGSPPSFSNIGEVEEWLQKKLGSDESRKQILLAEYRALAISELKNQMILIDDILSRAGFQLIPTPYPGFKYDGPANILGILATAGLLSLGAPFWFNALKSLGNLRPMVAARLGEK